MSAGDHAEVAHLCAVMAGRKVILRVQNPDLVQARLRVSDDTFRRMLSSSVPARWTYPRLLRLAALERDHLGTSTLDEVLDHRNRAFPQPRPADLQQAGRECLRTLSRRSADLTEAITSGHGIDDAELRRELTQIPHVIAGLQQFLAAGEAHLQRGAR